MSTYDNHRSVQIVHQTDTTLQTKIWTMAG